VVLNPVRAKTFRHPRQWKWSSYGATAGIVQPHGCLSLMNPQSFWSAEGQRSRKVFRVCSRAACIKATSIGT
jgi:hypothetical protein